MDELIRRYFREGAAKGFSNEYVRDTLISKGYDPVRVNMIYNAAYAPPQKRPLGRFYNFDSATGMLPPIAAPKNRWTLPAVTMAIVLVVLTGTLAFFLQSGPRIPTGAVVLDADHQESAQQALDHISTLDDQITKRQDLIREQLDQIDSLQISNEEKAAIIREQLHEIDALQASIQDEHDQVRNLLWDLMKTLLEEPTRHLSETAPAKPIQ